MIFRSAFPPPSQRQIDAALDDCAELLSTDRYSLREIATAMGVSPVTPCVLLHQICERLGEQAR